MDLDALCLSEVLEFSPLEVSEKKKHKHNSYQKITFNNEKCPICELN